MGDWRHRKITVSAIAVAVVLLVIETAAPAPAPTPGPAPASPVAPAVATTVKTTVSTIIDNGHKLFQIAAIIVGGAWAYIRFFRGRTFRPRLEPAIEATSVQIGACRHVKVKVRVKNVGLSKVPIDREVSGLRVLTYHEPRSGNVAADKISPVEWRRQRTLDVLKDHAWIEPGETIEDNWLLFIPSAQERAALRFELKLAGPATDWYANAVVETPSRPAPGVFVSLLERLLPSLQVRQTGGHDDNKAAYQRPTEQTGPERPTGKG